MTETPTHVATATVATKGIILPGHAARIARWRRERREGDEQ